MSTQKATELGVRALQPVFTRRTIVRRVNAERMRANAIEAAEQSGRLTVPEMRAPLDLDKLLAAWPAERRILFCDEAGEAPPIAEALARRAPTAPGPSSPARKAASIRPSARRSAPSPSSRRCRWAARILRADTAALAALAVWQALRGDWR